MSSTPASRIRAMRMVYALLVALLAYAAPAWSDDHADATASELASRLLTAAGVRGGLCVHLGCTDGTLTAELSQGGRFLVHGLSDDRSRVAEARRHIQSTGQYGRVSIDWCPLTRLPYADATVNVLVADDFSALVEGGLTLSSVVRVLAPRGTAFLRNANETGLREELVDDDGQRAAASREGEWVKIVKPVPPGMDEWQQADHDASRSAISKDELVGPPTGVRWIARGHTDALLRPYAVQRIVSANGRNIYLYAANKELIEKYYKHMADSPDAYLVARDAFNGLKLWEREGSAGAPLVAAGDRIYTTLDRGGQMVALEAATGKVVRTYAVHTRDIVYDGRALFVRGGSERWDADSGEAAWKRTEDGRGRVVVADGKLFCTMRPGSAEAKIVCLDPADGKDLWQVPSHDGGALFCGRAGLLFAVGRKRAPEGHGKAFTAITHAYKADDGRHLWSYEYVTPYKGKGDLYLLGDRVWVQAGPKAGDKDRSDGGAWIALDPTTGKETERIDYGPKVKLRCYGHRATERYILLGGMDFFDFNSGKHYVFHGSRGVCVFGYMPANGLTYQTRNLCMCFQQVHGTMALSSEPLPDLAMLKQRSGVRTERGAAFGMTAGKALRPDGWPTFRHDVARAGGTPMRVPGDLETVWEKELDTPVSALTATKALLLVAEIDRHRVVALEPATGTVRWAFTAGGRVDSPPSITSEAVLFGSRDGWVYCLKASDGALAWRFRAAPEDRRIVVEGQLESAWPVHGAVLVLDGVACFSAGRHSEVDGGICLYGVDVQTGQAVWEKVIVRQHLFQQTSASGIGNIANDVLTSDGDHVYLRTMPFDPKTGELRSVNRGRVTISGGAVDMLTDYALPPYGFKHGADYYRTYWAYLPGHGARGTVLSGWGDRVFGGRFSDPYRDRGGYKIFGASLEGGKEAKVWTHNVPDGMWMKAVLFAHEKVFFAIQPDLGDPSKGQLWVRAAADGKDLGAIALHGAPIFDGMAAADGRLFVVTQQGHIICLGKQ